MGADGRTTGSATVLMPVSWHSLIENKWDDGDGEAAMLLLSSLVGRDHAPYAIDILQVLAVALSPPLPALKPQALDLLKNIATANSAHSIAAALPGYQPDPLLSHKLYPAPSVRRTRKQIEDDDETSAMEKMGERLSICLDLWAILGGVANKGKEKREPTRENPVMEGAWDTISTLVSIFEQESALRRSEDESYLSPSFLRQFARDPSGHRTLSSRCLNVVFWPFEHEEPTPTSTAFSDPDEEETETELEMDLGEKQRIAARLMALVGNLAAKFETGKVTLDTMRRLQELSDDNFALFIDLLSIHSPSFTILLCTLYLESHSHPLANSSMSVRPANGASPNKARKAFDPNGPSASQESSQTFPASPTTQTGSGIGKKALLGLVGRIPIGVPVRRAKDGTITLSRSIGAAGPIASSARRHQVVKMALVSSVEELAGKRRGETGQHEKEMRPILQEIDGAVMRAMERAQGDAMDQSEDD